jgi:hypothetical protein
LRASQRARDLLQHSAPLIGGAFFEEAALAYAARQNSTPICVEVRQAMRQHRTVRAVSNVKENLSGSESALGVASRAPSEEISRTTQS